MVVVLTVELPITIAVELVEIPPVAEPPPEPVLNMVTLAVVNTALLAVVVPIVEGAANVYPPRYEALFALIVLMYAALTYTPVALETIPV